MAITDILSDSGNVSAVIELITLFFIVAGFFRWYDSRYQKTIKDSKAEILAHVDDSKKILSERLNHIDQSLFRLEDRFNEHITRGGHGEAGERQK